MEEQKTIQQKINDVTLEVCDMVAANYKGKVPHRILVARRIAKGMHYNNGVQIKMGLAQLVKLSEKYLPGALSVEIKLKK
jgi:hypothetical protein